MRSVPILLALVALPAFAQITTSQYDNQRTRANLNETILTPKNVNALKFGKVGAFQVDGPVYAQPLHVPGLDVPGKAATMCSIWPRSMTACMPSMLTIPATLLFGRFD
jgi:hypothetical protein